jgi:hypothetical protein
MTRRWSRLYPRSWRAEYGAELDDLIGETTTSPSMIVDVLRGAIREHARQRSGVFVWLAAAAVFAMGEVASFRVGVTRNVLWAPTDPIRSAYLLLTIFPIGGRDRDVDLEAPHSRFHHPCLTAPAPPTP